MAISKTGKMGPTYSDMVRIIQEGGSVLIDGKIISKVSGLPEPIVVAGGDPTAKAEATSDLLAERDRINRLLAEHGVTEETESGLLVPEGTAEKSTSKQTADALGEAADDMEDANGEKVEPDLSLPGGDAEGTDGAKKKGGK